jgi:hypothetical protein
VSNSAYCCNSSVTRFFSCFNIDAITSGS